MGVSGSAVWPQWGFREGGDFWGETGGTMFHFGANVLQALYS